MDIRGFQRVRLWHILCSAAIGFGLLFGFVHVPGLFPITLLAIVCYIFSREQQPLIVRVIAGIGILILSAGLFVHVIPGFSNPKVIAGVALSQGGTPYTRYLNFDKTLVGLFILGFTFTNLLTTPRAWFTMIKKTLPVASITIVTIMLMSFVMGYVRFDPKWTSIFGIWAWSNLFFTCIAEEAVFRGFIQRYLVILCHRYRYGAAIGITIAAILFGLLHYPGGVKYIILATVAGLGYGWAYHRTGRIEASILTHFLLNTIHFLFFTYPVLASATG